MCGLQFFFNLPIFVFFFLLSLIASQSIIDGVLIILSRTNISWSGVACRVVCYVLHTAKAVASNIPNQGLYSSR